MRKILSQYRGMNRTLRGMLWLVALPTLLTALYYLVIASDIFVSETHFTVRTHGASAPTDLLSGLVSGGSSNVAQQDIAILADYINSRDILDALQAKLDLRAHFSAATVDFYAALAKDATEEDFLNYFRKRVAISVDDTSGIVTLKTKAFSREVAKAMAQEVLLLSEQLINTISLQITEDSLRFAREELQIAETRLQQTTAALTRFRNLTNTVDPTEKTGAVLGIITGLESQLAAARTELSELRSYMRENNAQVAALKTRIQALQQQIVQENERLTGEEQAKLSSLLQEYEQLQLDKQLAHEFYTSTLASLESARIDALRKQLYLVNFVTPKLADDAIEPERLWNTLTVFIVTLLAFIILNLLWATVKDHMGMS